MERPVRRDGGAEPHPGLSWTRAADRLRESRAPALGLVGFDGAALGTNPHRLAEATLRLQALHDAVASGGTPTAAEARSTLALVFGAAYDGVPHGAGASLRDHLDHLRAATKKGDAEATSTSRAAFQAEAGAALSVLNGLREAAQTEAQQSDVAALEAHLLPGEGRRRPGSATSGIFSGSCWGRFGSRRGWWGEAVDGGLAGAVGVGEGPSRSASIAIRPRERTR